MFLMNVFYESAAEAVILGFQHYVVMLGTTILIPTLLVQLIGGGHEEKARLIQTVLFVAGINTLLQSWLGTRLPVVIGGSFTYLLPTFSIIVSERFADIADPHERFVHIMRAIQGALLAASSFQIIAGFCGIWRISIRFLSPLAAVPIVTFAGLGVFNFGFPIVVRCVEIGLPALLLIVALSQYAPNAFSKRRIILDRFSVLISAAVIWAYAHILTASGAYRHSSPSTQSSCRTDRAGLVGASPWIRFPYPFQWGAPTFNAGDVFAMMAASFASLVESTGIILAASRFASATFVPPSVFSRGVGWQGVGILLSGMFGTANGSAASIENAGLLALTQVGSRRVVEISAGFMIFFSILGKFGSLIASIPLPIAAAMNCVLYGFSAAAGLGFLQFCNLNSLRTLFVLGLSMFLGLSISQYFKDFQLAYGYGPVHTRTKAFNDMIDVIFSSPATVATIIAYFLDSTLLRNNAQARRDRGWHWWKKFRSYKTDRRSEEFYALPYNLDKFFPSL
ncbi:nucleobase-ascorbate transporter 6-like [Phalaenopsis equestris]|uniref:nucleobase-ascorbate transporter 6-like n=1 Tax=Phalaenopsis equestris TaxID=78828 RepID=UPI0009E2EDC6|nr:nucleobase-ascorbate transporter 6-like [Phalaenopsis equestris]